MRYSITMSIGRDKYGYDEVTAKAEFEADGLQRLTLHAIAAAMVNDVTEKADAKFNKPEKPPVSSAEEEITSESKDS